MVCIWRPWWLYAHVHTYRVGPRVNSHEGGNQVSGIGASGVILLVIVALLLFGPNKLPELGRAFGKTLREFKNGAKDIMEDDPKPERKEVNRIDSTTDEQGSKKLPE